MKSKPGDAAHVREATRRAKTASIFSAPFFREHSEERAMAPPSAAFRTQTFSRLPAGWRGETGRRIVRRAHRPHG